MCEPISIGIAIGAGMAAIQGGGPKEILIGAAFGAAGGAAGAGGFGSFGNVFSALPGQVFTGVATSTIQGAFLGSAIGGLLSGPKTPDYGYTPAAQQVQYNSQNIATTGSGGRQATASLADAIKRSKKRKLTQEDVGDLSIDTSSFANTGLQLA
jgi:hypothetical protein